MKGAAQRVPHWRIGWLLLWIFGVPKPLLFLLLVLRDLTGQQR